MRAYWNIFFILFASIFLFQCGKEPQIVARIGNQKIEVDELRKQFGEDYPGVPIERISLEDRRKSLNTLIDRRLMTAEAFKLGMDKDPEFLMSKENKLDQSIARELYRKVVIDSLVPPKLVEDYYRWKSVQMKTVMVWIAYKGISGFTGSRTKAEADTLARKIANELIDNNQPEIVALQFSSDPGVEQNKGVQDPFLVGRYGFDIDRAVFGAKKGDAVGPLDTQRGYLVVKIMDRRDYPPAGDFETEKPLIKQQVFQIYFRQKARDYYLKDTRKYLKKFNGRLFPENIKKAAEIFRTMARLDNKAGQLDKTKRSLLLVQIGDQSVTVGDLADRFKIELTQVLNQLADVNYLKKTLSSRMEYLGWILEAKERGFTKSKKIKNEMKQFTVNQLAAFFDKKMVQDKVTVKNAEVKAYYEKHKSEFVDPEKIRIWQIAVMDKNQIDEIAKKLKRGANFEKLAKKYNASPIMRKKSGDMGYQSRQSIYGTLAQKALEAGANKTIGPLKFGPGYFMLKTGDIKPQRYKSLKEVRGLVEKKIRQVRENEIRKTVLDKYRKDFSFRINETLLRSIS